MNIDFSMFVNEYKKQSVLNKAINIINEALERGEEIVLYKECPNDVVEQLKLTKGDELNVLSYRIIG